MILSTPCAKKRKCRICTNKRTAALTNKPRFAEPGFAVCLKQGHCLPAFAVRLKREYGLARLVMTEPSSLAVQNLFRQFFRYLSCSPGQELFLRTAKNYKPVSHFCSNGRTFISTQRSRLFPKAEMSGLFHQIIGQQNAVPLRLLFFQYPIAPFFKKRTGGN